MDNQFILRYLPMFEQDLASTCNHIAVKLQNPTAALRLVNDTEKAILERLVNPLWFPPYRSVKDRKQPYYTIKIRNFLVFYVVIGNIMEVRRFVYSKRNLSEIV